MTGIFLIIGACFLWALDALIRYPLVGKGFSAVSLVFIEHTMLAVLSAYLFFSNISKLKQNKFKPIWYFFIIGGVGSALATVAFTRAFVCKSIFGHYSSEVSASCCHCFGKNSFKRNYEAVFRLGIDLFNWCFDD